MPSTPAFPDYSPVSWTTARVVLWFLFATSLFFAFFSFVQGVVDAGLVMLAFASAAFALASLIGRRAQRVRFDEENAALIFTRGAKTTETIPPDQIREIVVGGLPVISGGSFASVLVPLEVIVEARSGSSRVVVVARGTDEEMDHLCSRARESLGRASSKRPGS